MLLPYNEKELDKLEGKIRNNDKEALSLLKDNLRHLEKRANSRLLRLERAEIENSSTAYGRAVFYTQMEHSGSKRFRLNQSMDIDELLTEYREVRTFLQRPSSKVSRVKEAQEKSIESLQAYGIHISEDDRKAFFAFIGSDTIQDVIEFVGEYDIIMDIISNNMNKIKDSFTNLKRQFDSFLAGDMYLDELIERVGGMDIEEVYKRSRKRGIDYSKRLR